MFTMDLEEIKKSQAVIISALSEINNTLEEPTVEYLRQRKTKSKEWWLHGHRRAEGVTTWSRSAGAAVRRYL